MINSFFYEGIKATGLILIFGTKTSQATNKLKRNPCP